MNKVKNLKFKNKSRIIFNYFKIYLKLLFKIYNNFFDFKYKYFFIINFKYIYLIISLYLEDRCFFIFIIFKIK